MSLDTPLIFLEDVTTTGILREKVSGAREQLDNKLKRFQYTEGLLDILVKVIFIDW